MPKPGMHWRHCVIGTLNSWLPGDPRGFRAKDHKIHSSGDYKNPPPEGEHAGLHEYSKSISGDPVIIPPDLRELVGQKILEKLRKLDYQVLAIAVGGMHCHFLAELPESIAEVRQIVGQCKTVSSHAEHQRNTFHYILGQENAWVWSYRDEPK